MLKTQLNKNYNKQIIKGFNFEDKKSNRAFSDYSEISVTKALCSEFGVLFKNENDLILIKKKIKSYNVIYGSKIVLSKTNIQERNIPLLVKGCLKILKCEMTKGENVEDILWVGRNKGGSEDILVVTNFKKIRISLKSISKNGDGTLKNLGSSSFSKIGIDISEYSIDMKTTVVKATENYLNKRKLNITYVKDLSKRDIKVKELAEQKSLCFLSDINSFIFKKMKNMENKNKNEFVDFINKIILDITTDPLWSCVANSKGYTIQNQEINSVSKKDKLKIVIVSDKSFKVIKNGENFLRLNTCCTNGKGLSSVCVRVFNDI